MQPPAHDRSCLRPPICSVFLGSTSVDLGRHRGVVRDTLNSLDFHVRGMEHFNARGSGDATSVSLSEVAACDVFVCVVAWRYGHVPQVGGPSVTEQEYSEAFRLRKPCFIFLADLETERMDGSSDAFPATLRDPQHAAQLRAFRAHLCRTHVVDFFTTEDNLARKVNTALSIWLLTSGRRAPRLAALKPKDCGGTESGLPLPHAAARRRSGQADDRGLVGRAEDLDWLTRRVLDRSCNGVWAVSGLGGIGKTAIVAVGMDIIKDRLTGGLAVVRAANIDDAGIVLRDLVRKFVDGGEDILRRAKESREPLSRALREVLESIRDEGRSAAIVIDNVEPSLAGDQYFRQLMELLSAAGANVVLTARETLSHMYVHEERPLKTLTEDDSIRLFARLCGRFPSGDVGEHAAEIASICRTFDGHALAIVVAAAELRQSPLVSLVEYRNRLAEPFHVLNIDSLVAPGGVKRVLASSYDQLPEGAQRLFSALGVLAGPSCAKGLAVALGVSLGRSAQEAEANLNRLVTAGLVSRPAHEDRGRAVRLELHPLLHQFACSLFDSVHPTEADLVRRGMASYFASWAPGRSVPELRVEEEDLLASHAWARAQGQAADAILAGLCFGLRWYWENRKDSAQAFELLRPGYEAIERLCHPNIVRRRRSSVVHDGTNDLWRRRQSLLAFALGKQYQLAGALNEAEEWFKRSHRIAKRIAQRTKDDLLLAETLSGLAALSQQRGRSSEARTYYERSLELYQRDGDRPGTADTLYCLGFLALRTGDTGRAAEYFSKSLESLTDSPDDEMLRAVDLYSLGNVYHQTGPYERAAQHYREALATCVRMNLRRGQGAILKAMGDLDWLTTGPHEALEHLSASLALFRQISDRQAQGVALYSYAFVHRQIGKIDEAVGLYNESLEIRRNVKDLRGEGFVLKAIGDLKRRTAGTHSGAGVAWATQAEVRSDMREALRTLERGLELTRAASDMRNVGVALKAIGDWHWQSGNLQRAASQYRESVHLRTDVSDAHGRVSTLKALADVHLVHGRLDDGLTALRECDQIMEQLGDVRGLGTVRHSLAVQAWLRGSRETAADLLEQSRELLTKVQDQQFLAVASYTAACFSSAPGSIGDDEAETNYRAGLRFADISRAVLVDALLEENLGGLLLGRGGEHAEEGRRLVQHAAQLYRGMSRYDDAKRCLDQNIGGQVGPPSEKIVRGLMFDVDEGPNGQGFAIPNDRRRTGA